MSDEVVFRGTVTLTDYDEIMEILAGDTAEQLEATVPFSGGAVEGPCRLAIDFPDPQAMGEWFASARNSYLLPEDVSIFLKDALDGRIGDRNAFVVKRDGDRPDDFKLHVKRTEIEPA